MKSRVPPYQSVEALAMTAWRVLTVIASLGWLSAALAHSFPVTLEVTWHARLLTVRASDPDGRPVIGAFRVQLLGAAGALEETALQAVNTSSRSSGRYSAVLPRLESGEYTLRIIDATFPNEAVDAATTLNVPSNATLRLTIPAYVQRQTPLVIWALVLTPVFVVAIALVVVLLAPRAARDTSSRPG
ncbi:MAG: carboxypeptidase regulatory-like domain-containing protein [Pleurocapsa sp. SU_196_0]|nr:carboxypeptidase regulatory-like domain-containing protein [Pleurocapsa sp. SU_196_0]